MKYFLLRNTQSVYIKEYIKSHCFLKLVLYISYYPGLWLTPTHSQPPRVNYFREDWGMTSEGEELSTEWSGERRRDEILKCFWIRYPCFLYSFLSHVVLWFCIRMQFPRLTNPWMFVVIGLRSCLEYRNISPLFYCPGISAKRKNKMIIFHNWLNI